MIEIWKNISEYSGLYMVSNTGKVRSMQWNHTSQVRELKQYDQGGYKLVGIRRNGKHHNHLVHRLVAEAFVDNPRCLNVVNHIDGNKSNNNADNLEWVTSSENTRHAIRMGLRPLICVCERKRGKENKLCKKVAQFTTDMVPVKVWDTTFDVEEELGYKRQFICRVCRGERKTYKGFIWRYC